MHLTLQKNNLFLVSYCVHCIRTNLYYIDISNDQYIHHLKPHNIFKFHSATNTCCCDNIHLRLGRNIRWSPTHTQARNPSCKSYERIASTLRSPTPTLIPVTEFQYLQPLQLHVRKHVHLCQNHMNISTACRQPFLLCYKQKRINIPKDGYINTICSVLRIKFIKRHFI